MFVIEYKEQYIGKEHAGISNPALVSKDNYSIAVFMSESEADEYIKVCPDMIGSTTIEKDKLTIQPF